jgi:hypothetical protein
MTVQMVVGAIFFMCELAYTVHVGRCIATYSALNLLMVVN